MEVIGKGGFPKVIGLYRGHIGVIFYGSYIVFRVPKIIGDHLGGPHNKDHRGSPHFGKLQNLYLRKEDIKSTKAVLGEHKAGEGRQDPFGLAVGELMDQAGQAWRSQFFGHS